MRALLLLLQLGLLLREALMLQVAPTWVTSPLVRADQFNVINNVMTGNKTTPTATMTFSSSFTQVPNLAYGTINYQGNDRLGEQYYEIYRIGLTASSFSVNVQIRGITNIWMLTVRYIAVDRAFPHHLNSFDNVPVNYTRGPLTNISVAQTFQTFYVNVVNYTTQAAANGYAYRTFVAPYSNYKILLFLTSLFLDANFQRDGDPLRPLDLSITTTILSDTTYMFNTSVKIEASISRLHFSMLIFDQANVQASHQYTLISEKINLATSGGFLTIPQQFIPNLIIGFIEYSTTTTKSAIHYNLKFQSNPTNTTQYGIYMPVSVPRYGYTALSRFGYTLFYMKTWACQTGTFFNMTSNLCQSCSISNCQECQFIDVCRVCAAGLFLVATAAPAMQCTTCPLAYCLACASATACQVCDEAKGYFLDPATGLCAACSIPHCVSCSSLTVCIACDEPNSFFLDPASEGIADQCIACSIAYCLQCSSLTTCLACDQASGYFANNAPVALAAAPAAAAPTSATISDQCILCTLSFCIQCSNLAECATCDTGYILNQATKLCEPCTVPNCLVCNDSLCTTCNTPKNYFLNPNTSSTDQCIACTIPDCLICIDLTACQACNAETNHFLNPTPTNLTDICILCNAPQCILCATLATCATCNETYGYFLNPAPTSNLDQCIFCSIAYCIDCASLTSCLLCNQTANYFVNGGSTGAADACLLCTLAQCIQCANLLQCSTCNQNNSYFLNTTDLQCYPCTLPNCLQCATLTSCSICNTTAQYYLNLGTGLCEIPPPRCGDNIFRLPEECDDGNSIANDGCSPLCTVQVDWVCEPNPDITMFNSLCYFMGQITINVVYIEKIDTANQIEILLEISPAQMAFWDTVDFASMVTLFNMVGFDGFTVKSNTDGTVSILINYSQDIHNTDITVQLDPAKSGKQGLSRTPPTQRNFPILPTDNEAALAYNDEMYKNKQIVSYLAVAVAALSLFFFLLSIFARKLVGIEMVAVVQISYLSLLTLNSMNPCFKALTNIWFVNGFNYFSTLDRHHLRDSFSPMQVKGIFMYSRFMQNYNLTCLLICLPLLTGLIYHTLSKTVFAGDPKKKYNLQKFSKICLCETTYQGIMYSGYVISVSLALQFVYGIRNRDGFIGGFSIAESILLLGLYVGYFGGICWRPELFGEFVSYFGWEEKQREKEGEPEIAGEDREGKESKSSKINKKWYNILMLQRLLVGSCLVFLLQTQLSPIPTILIFLSLALYTLIFKPYTKRMHNIRFTVNMLVCIAIQGIYLGYKRTSFQEQNSRAVWFVMPIVVCVLLLLTVGYNSVVLIYELVAECRRRERSQPSVERDERINFQLFNQQTCSPKHHTDSITRLTSSGRAISPTDLNTRRQLDSIRKQIKKDFAKRDALLNKSEGLDLSANFYERMGERESQGQGEGIRKESLEMGETGEEAILLGEKYRERLPELERKKDMEIYAEI